MSMNDYAKYCSVYQNISGSLRVLTATDDTTLVTGRASDTIFLQKLHIEVTDLSATSWSFTDSAGTPVKLVPLVSTAAVAHFDFDFGPRGIPLTEGKNFLLDVTATGAAGFISWEGYQKRTLVGAP